MSEDSPHDWLAEAEGYDANAALTEIRSMWLQLARKCGEVVRNCDDWLHDPDAADEVMRWAARTEACLWRATGDAAAFDVETFVLPRPHQQEGSDA